MVKCEKQSPKLIVKLVERSKRKWVLKRENVQECEKVVSYGLRGKGASKERIGPSVVTWPSKRET